MTFLGFLILENKLKEVSTEVIKTLNECNIQAIMATGDNVLTAVKVARDCNIIGGEERVYIGEVNNDDVLVWKSSLVG